MNNQSKNYDNAKNTCGCSCGEKDIKDSSSSSQQENLKNEGNNQWESVPKTYDKDESCHKNEKTATNNQWCSCSK
ncbi:hypothetical protein [Clostridium saccharobutylicum]|uniref:Uncharacterized protein n=1 Tax=Clostridium saccharobutylicum DSM 13864 TaxID=1345695 RepID=U5MVU8_CLOSA|nr:hypothetical protein [Clostridium saccharobutylicum]AGX43567.1 hypothetical protein CLSA_c25960 [Clostridium saccharobutylicum DSM 13864]AQR90865.1 hypothetical protein CLOSC_25860 [Clostridium saccharobutylicum]AQS00769.1 hypothetical protein CSACC_25930 [Clostridium saccharobutylicum]AQS10431.1 hypothetical protein CLOBY_25740 [Clostridium saccharobutylicum]AQS14752.1 hypothetical protein CLOSACC_25930 [Clostridium saccharobutylicum]